MPDTSKTTKRPALSLVPPQPELIRAGLILADFSLELRAAGRRSEMASEVFEETPDGQTRSGTMMLLTHRAFEDALREFDKLAAKYMNAKLRSVRKSRDAG